MIAKIISFIILVPLAVILLVFCIANREAVTISLDPFGTMPQLGFAAPLFVLLMVSLIVGVILGGFGTWLTQGHYRRKSWKRKYEVERLRREAEEHKAEIGRLRTERGNAGALEAKGDETAGRGKPSTAMIASRAA